MTDMAQTDGSSEITGGGHHVTGTEHHSVWLRGGLFAGVLVAGVLAMNVIASMREDPPVREETEMIVRARGIVVSRSDFQTVLRGYGTVQSRREADILPQVSGRVVWTHPNLKAGGIVGEGETMLRIDDSDYAIAVERAEADVLAGEADVERLAREHESEQRRLALSTEMLAIARRDYERIETLVGDGGVESESALDMASSRVTQEEDKVANMELAIALFPARSKSAGARLKTARAQLEQAKLNLARTTVEAPFTARIVSESVDVGQYVTPATRILRVADDSLLEIPVSIDGTEAAEWLRFAEGESSDGWFFADPGASVRVRWTGSEDSLVSHGRIARVADYDRETRTLDLVIEVTDALARGAANGLTLSAGMFCEVEIEGRVAENVVAIPRAAVDSQGDVLVSEDGRLKTVSVTVARFERDMALVSDGLETDDIVLTDRPGRIVDGLRLEVTLLNDAPAGIDG